MRLARGDIEAYQDGCHELLRRYLESAEPPFPGWELAWCCKLAPLRDQDIQQVERLARESFAAAPDDVRARHELACILCRAGKFAESLEHQCVVREKSPKYSPWLGIWMSMAHLRLGNTEEAKKCLEEAVEASKKQSASWTLLRPLAFELLRREAASLLESAQTKQDESPAGNRDN